MTLYSPKALSLESSYRGTDGQNVHSKNRAGGEESLIAQVWLVGPLAIMSSPLLPSVCLLWETS